jgi:hypothetical protein
MIDHPPDPNQLPGPTLTGLPIASGSIIVTGGVAAARFSHSPTGWRLARRNGELVLQARSFWTQGIESGIEWKDVPTLNLDELEALNG